MKKYRISLVIRGSFLLFPRRNMVEEYYLDFENFDKALIWANKCMEVFKNKAELFGTDLEPQQVFVCEVPEDILKKTPKDKEITPMLCWYY